MGQAADAEVRRRWVIAASGIVACILLGAVAWVGIRGALAADHLRELASALGVSGSSRDLTLDRIDVGAAGERAAAAHGLVGDPLWLTAENAPFVGADLRALRVLAEEADLLLHQAVLPAVASLTAGGAATGASISATHIAAMTGVVDGVSAAASRLDTRLAGVEPSFGDLREVVERARPLLPTVGAAADAAARLLDRLDELSGMSGPQTYLALFMTSAELRALGGLPGAAALVRADGGEIEPIGILSTADYLPTPSVPVVPMRDDETALLGDWPARLLQDTTATDDFPRAAEFARALTRHHFAIEPAGVFAVDVEALAAVLDATGPIHLVDGYELSSGNAVRRLTSEVYWEYPEQEDQDAYFADVADRVIAAVTGPEVDPLRLAAAAVRAAAEGRLLGWVADDQAQTAADDLAALLDRDAATTGIRLNDRTSAKMDVYLDAQADVAWAWCGDRRVQQAQVTLVNRVDPELVAALPEYVSGGGTRVDEGTILTQVIVAAPEGAQVGRANEPPDVAVTDPSGRHRTSWTVELAPGESAVRTVTFTDAVEGAPAMAHTPSVTIGVRESTDVCAAAVAP